MRRTPERTRPAMLAEPELAIVQRARRGDHDAFRAIVVAYQHKVHDLLARMLAGIVSVAEVEELAQETFVRIYRALPRFEPEGPGRLTRWVLTVTTHVGVDVLRRRRVMTEPLDDAAVPDLTTHDPVTRSDLGDALARAVAALPAPHRAAFVLREYHGFEMEEIAELLAIEPGTVKSRLSRARATLRVALAFAAGLCVAAIVALRAPGAPPAEVAAPVTPGPADGALVADARTHARLGDAAVAVVEPGAELRWRTRDGKLEVDQPRGRVFYRAEQPLAVKTPLGALDVTGTSFSIDSAPAHTDLVVYEGTVVAAHDGRRVAVHAGRRVRITARGIDAERPAPWLDDAPVAGAVAARAAHAASCDRAGEDNVFDPGAAALAAWAAECRLYFDVAPNGYDAGGLEHYLDRLGVSAEERPVVRDTILAIEARADGELARQYVDVSGDDRGPEQLSDDWMFSEVMRSADPDEPAELRRRLSYERAGLEPAPAGGAASPYEEQVRWLMRSGDVLERELAATLGATRARALRARNGGWPGLRWDIAGCPVRRE